MQLLIGTYTYHPLPVGIYSYHAQKTKFLIFSYLFDQLHRERGTRIVKLETYHGIVVSREITSIAIEHGLHHMDQKQCAGIM